MIIKENKIKIDFVKSYQIDYKIKTMLEIIEKYNIKFIDIDIPHPLYNNAHKFLDNIPLCVENLKITIFLIHPFDIDLKSFNFPFNLKKIDIIISGSIDFFYGDRYNKVFDKIKIPFNCITTVGYKIIA